MTCKAVEYAEQDLTGVLSGMSALRLATGPYRRRDQGSAAPAHVMVVDGNMREDALADLARSVDKVIKESLLRPHFVVCADWSGSDPTLIGLGRLDRILSDSIGWDRTGICRFLSCRMKSNRMGL